MYKYLLIVSFTFLFLGTTPFLSAQHSYEYNLDLNTGVELPLKQVYSHLTEGLNISNRNIQENGMLKFYSSTLYDKSIFELRALDYGLDSIIVSIKDSKLQPPASPKLGGQDCEDAFLVCNNQSFAGNSNGFATQELNASNRGCISSNETQTSWYYVNVGTAGTLGMTIAPANGTDDYDFAIWGPYTAATASLNCPPTSAPIRCNWALYPRVCHPWGCFFGMCGTNTNPTGMAINAALPTSTADCPDQPFVRHIDANVGDIYILMIDNYSGSTQPFELTWSGTALLACIPVTLPVSYINFGGSELVGSNRLDWSTESERDNDYFKLERSIDGLNWIEVGEVSGSGTTNIAKHYFIHDKDIENNIIYYYRLKQFDFDGKMETHDDIVAILNNHAKPHIVKVINSLGQEVSTDATGLIFEIYSDGSRVKKFNP